MAAALRSRYQGRIAFVVAASLLSAGATSAQVANLAVNTATSVLSTVEGENAQPSQVTPGLFFNSTLVVWLHFEGLRDGCRSFDSVLSVRVRNEDGTAIGADFRGLGAPLDPPNADYGRLWAGQVFQIPFSGFFPFPSGNRGVIGFPQDVFEDSVGEPTETFTFIVEPAGASQTTAHCDDESEQTVVIPTIRVTLTIRDDDRLLGEIPDSTVTQQSVGDVLQEICQRPDLPSDVRRTCDELAELSDAEIRDALRELSPEKTATQGETSLGFTLIQQRNLFGRLAELRRGRRLSASGLSVQTPRGALPLQRIIDGLNRRGSVFGSSPALPGRPGFSLWKPAGAPQSQNDASEKTETPFEEQRRLGLFVSGLVGAGDRDTTDRQTGFEVDNVGLTGGVDYQFTPKLVFGGAFGWSTLDADLAHDGGAQDSDGQSASTYVLYQVPDQWFFEGTATYGQADFEIQRGIAFPGRLSVARAATDGDQLGATVGAGIERVWGASTLEVYARGSYIDAAVDGYAESGAPGFNLRISDQDVESMEGSLVFDFSRAFSTGEAVLIPALRVSYLRQFENDSRPLGAVFIGDPSGTVFSVPSDEPDESYANAALGLSATFGGGTSFFVQVESDFARDDLELWVASTGLRWPIR